MRPVKKARAAAPADALSHALGPSFSAVRATRAERDLVQIEHIPSGTIFVAIPGGTLEMGQSRAEVEDLSKLAFEEDVTREDVDSMRGAKTKRVEVAAFLCARAPVHGALAERVLGEVGWAIDEDDPTAGVVRVHAKDAGKLARAFAKDGLRLLTSPEWEWVAREGGARHWINADDARGAEKACAALYNCARFGRDAKPPTINGWGVWGLPWGDFVAEARGTRRTAWGVRGGAAMLYPWQTDEIMMCVASFGYRLGKSKEQAGVRFAVDMPEL